jgi:excisionase family DNA binding protein
MGDEKVISTGTAARILHVTQRTVERWCDRGDLRSFRTAGGHRRIYRSSIDELLNAPPQSAAA